MQNIPKVGEYYKKSDKTYLIIRSYEPDEYDIKYYNAKRRYMIYAGNETWGYQFYKRCYSLSEARKAVLEY